MFKIVLVLFYLLMSRLSSVDQCRTITDIPRLEKEPYDITVEEGNATLFKNNQDINAMNEKKIVDDLSEDRIDKWDNHSIYGDNYVFGLGDELVYETKSYGLITSGAWFNPYEVFGGLMIKRYSDGKKMLFDSRGAKEKSVISQNNICIFNSLIIDTNNINTSSNYIPTFTLGKSLDGGDHYMQEISEYDICGSIKWFPFSSTVVDIFNDNAWESFGIKELTATWKFDECENYANYIYACAVTGEEVKHKYNQYLEWFTDLRSIKFVYEESVPKDYDRIGYIPNSNGLVCIQNGSELVVIALDKTKKIFLSQDASNLFSCIALGKRYTMSNCIIDLKNVDCSLTTNWTDTFLGCEDNIRNLSDYNEVKENKEIPSANDIYSIADAEIRNWLYYIIEKYNIEPIDDKFIHRSLSEFFESAKILVGDLISLAGYEKK